MLEVNASSSEMTLRIWCDTIRDTLDRFAGKELEVLLALGAAVKWDLRVKISEKSKVESVKRLEFFFPLLTS